MGFAVEILARNDTARRGAKLSAPEPSCIGR
jgi:hypothetical protein